MAFEPDDLELSEQAAHALLAVRAARYAHATEEQATIVGSAMSFRRGGSLYAAPLDRLKEVRPLGVWCPLVGARATVPGVLHHRGELLSVHDLVAYTDGRQEGTPGWAIVIEDGDERIALLADEVLDVLAIEQTRLCDVPVTLGDAADGFVALYAGEILLLDVAALFASAAFMDAY